MTASKYSQDQAQAAAIAAALIKTTAESTATALNIQYIQKDILEIKQTLKDMGLLYVRTGDFEEHAKIEVDHESRIRIIEKSMWKWIGMASVGGGVVSAILAVALKFVCLGSCLVH